MPNGDLIAGGAFSFAGGVQVNWIARWNGSAWSALGSGVGGSTFPWVYALAILPNGDLVAGGAFSFAGGVLVGHVARWDGSAWSALGSGVGGGSSHIVFSLATLPNGDLVAGGLFTTAGGAPASAIARWNGSAWFPLGTGVSWGTLPAVVRSLAALSNGDLVAGGDFASAGGVPANRIARWNGSSWSALGSGTNGSVRALRVLPSGDLVAGGSFLLAGGAGANHIARWSGSSWSTMSTGMSHLVHSLTLLTDGALVAGGEFSTAGGVFAKSIARWSGSGWSAVGTAIGGTSNPSVVHSLIRLDKGEVVVGGYFGSVGGVAANSIARWDGSTWSALGPGIGGVVKPSVLALAEIPDGDLVAGGDFTTAGGGAAKYVARWDGSTWSGMGAGMGGTSLPIVRCLAVLPNGDVIAGGDFATAGSASANRIARWNGSNWSAMGSGMSGGDMTRVYALRVLSGGDLVAGGDFTFASGVPAKSIARWNGSIWTALGLGISGHVFALAELPNGDLIAGGWFNAASGISNNIARWDGSNWFALGSGIKGGDKPSVHALAVLPGGELVAGGNFTSAGGGTANRVARWTGSKWFAIGTGVSGTNAPAVYMLDVLPGGHLAVGGQFLTADGVVAPNLARWGCPPSTCYADCDASGALSIADYICFSNEFAAQSTYADCDASGTWNIFDYICFSDAYTAGCP